MTAGILLRTAGIFAFAVALSGCENASDAASDALSDALSEALVDEPARDVAALIGANNPKACANEAAIHAALGAAHGNYEAYLSAGGPQIIVDTISAREIDKSVHEITCSGILNYNVGDTDQTAQIIYKLRPSLGEGGGFIAETKRTNAVQAAMNLHINGWYLTHQVSSNPTDDQLLADDRAEFTTTPPRLKPPVERSMSEPNEQSVARGSADPLDAAASPGAANPAEAAPAQEAPSFR